MKKISITVMVIIIIAMTSGMTSAATLSGAAKADPVIMWFNPTDIQVGTPLSVTQLNAVTSVPGDFVYVPKSGTILSVGSHPLHVDFTPTDTAKYNSVSKDVRINVKTASKKDQTITFGALPDKKITDVPFVVSATASSGLPVTFGISGPVTISGNTITITGIGTGPVTVKASQAGDSVYNAAPDVDRTFNVKDVLTSSGTVQGKVFNDLDSDKKIDIGEHGIAHVVVQLTGDDKITKKNKLKVKTDMNGNYIFSNLPDGKYKLHVETKHGWTYTTSTSKKVTIKSGNTITANFGEKPYKKH